MTHDLLAQVIERMGGQLERVVINELRMDTDLQRGTFIATIHIRRDGQLVEVDSRPSDAIALGAAFETPIFVAEEVLEDACVNPSDVAAQRKHLEVRRTRLAEHIVQVNHRLEDPEFAAGIDEEQMRTLRGHAREMQTELEVIEEILRQLP